jgi:type I restriction-modification system DNA methylase subunit
MANLFGKNKLRSIAQQIDTEEIKPFIEIVKEWHEDYHSGSLKRDKETSREQEYNQQFFKNILGYKEKPAHPFSFEPKATTDKGQLPDAVVSYTDAANDVRNIAAVVELKGASIDLDRPQQREGNFSPVQQGFKYKTQYRSVPFVIVSNFWEFRLYHDNLLDYEAWTLDDLVNPDEDYILFKTWYALLKRSNFTTSKGASKTEALLSDIRVEQENIGKEFYKVYREARLELLRDIYSNNEQVRDNIDIGVEKAQKIVDRIVFAAFAEDRGLLPDNTLQRVIKAADSSTFGGSLWNTLKGFFEAIDVGSEKLEIPDGYNGGLFKHDETLNNFRITDVPLRKVVELGTYNFSEDLSVNILGHIFEQSISDLEEIKSKVRESQNIDSLSVSRRKKDGIFYTPDYIVRYIVDNSLGAYLREHEEKFKNEFGLKGDINDKNYQKREKQAYSKYQDFLQNVKVVDPACGSGAFLVYVFDYLLAENKRVSDIVGNSLFSSDTYVRDILRNNIYGVDLNEESVEITKLSLWLKTAQKGKKLTALDGNIKCGNSLIDDPNIAGNKSFSWQEQFVDIFKQGGFDVVVGNPPYLRIQGLKDSDTNQTEYFERTYSSATGKYDLYALFMEKAFSLIKPTGTLSFILPHKFLVSDFGRGIRQFILDKKALNSLVSFGSDRIFQDAMTYTCIVKMTHDNSSLQYRLTPKENLFNHEKQTTIKYTDLGKVTWNLSNKLTSGILNKINSQPQKATQVFEGIYQGVVSMGDDIYMLRGKVSDGLFSGYSAALKKEVHLEAEILKPILKGQDIKRYADLSTNLYVIYPHIINDDGKTKPLEESILKTQYPLVYEYLSNFKELLQARKVKYKTNPTHWYALHRSREIRMFKSEKLITPQLQNYPNFTYDSNETYSDAGGYNLIPKSPSSKYIHAYLAILNSSLMWYFIKNTSSEFSGGFFYFKTKYIEPFGFPDISLSNEARALSDNAKLCMELQKDLRSCSDKFVKLTIQEYGLQKWSTKLSKWWELDFTNFTEMLKVNLSLRQKDELLELFEKYRPRCIDFDVQIKKAEYEINHLVYELYDLTPEETATVEGAK